MAGGGHNKHRVHGQPDFRHGWSLGGKMARRRSKRKHTHTHTRPYGPLSGTTQVSRYKKGKTNLDFTEAGDSEWQWHHLGHMQVCISLQTDNHASTPPLSFLQAGCPSCRRLRESIGKIICTWVGVPSSGGYTTSICKQPTRSTQPRILWDC